MTYLSSRTALKTTEFPTDAIQVCITGLDAIFDHLESAPVKHLGGYATGGVLGAPAALPQIESYHILTLPDLKDILETLHAVIYLLDTQGS